MKITKTGVNLLRYTSAMGKKCSVETSALKISKNSNLSYCGAPIYKTLPITTPLKVRLLNMCPIYYETFEFAHTVQKIHKNTTIGSWFDIIEP